MFDLYQSNFSTSYFTWVWVLTTFCNTGHLFRVLLTVKRIAALLLLEGKKKAKNFSYYCWITSWFDMRESTKHFLFSLKELCVSEWTIIINAITMKWEDLLSIKMRTEKYIEISIYLWSYNNFFFKLMMTSANPTTTTQHTHASLMCIFSISHLNIILLQCDSPPLVQLGSHHI